MWILERMTTNKLSLVNSGLSAAGACFPLITGEMNLFVEEGESGMKRERENSSDMRVTYPSLQLPATLTSNVHLTNIIRHTIHPM